VNAYEVCLLRGHSREVGGATRASPWRRPGSAPEHSRFEGQNAAGGDCGLAGSHRCRRGRGSRCSGLHSPPGGGWQAHALKVSPHRTNSITAQSRVLLEALRCSLPFTCSCKERGASDHDWVSKKRKTENKAHRTQRPRHQLSKKGNRNSRAQCWRSEPAVALRVRLGPLVSGGRGTGKYLPGAGPFIAPIRERMRRYVPKYHLYQGPVLLILAAIPPPPGGSQSLYIHPRASHRLSDHPPHNHLHSISNIQMRTTQ
jgi:hypothetical protein